MFLAFSIPGGFFAVYWPPFIFTSLAFHAFLYALLLFFMEDFRKEGTGEKLSSINMANRITLIRVSTLPTLLYLVIAAKSHRIRYPLLILVVFIFVTDFLDGYVSRKAKEVTKAGRMMDSASDYSLLIVLTLVFRYYQLIPIWFLVLVMTRLGIQVLLMAILILVKKKIDPRTTFMGKAAVASIMVLYSFELLGYITNGLSGGLKNFLEVAVGVIVFASVGDKIWNFAASLKGPKDERRIFDGDDKKRS
ncbi:MAG: CDP-alcohol phosphatidyltransferase family protein [Spirochaetes bacterium]|nr:CDP-alcohol phosphatidyltransferase family protein [Spirochaetota bacterium]